MSILSLIVREIRLNWLNFVFTALAVAVAAAVPVAARLLLASHDRETSAILEQKERAFEDDLAYVKEEMRKATLKLKFNMVILPEGQDLREWHTEDAGSATMPESYVDKLADSGIVSVRHFLPSLQKRIVWPETKRRIILVGSRGEVPNMHKNPRKPLVQPVPEGTIVLGSELHRSLNLAVGDEVTLMGRRFKVHRCHEPRGSKDDITAWVYLKAAQEMLGQPGRINAILALECLCVGIPQVERFRADVQQVLPGTVVVEQGTKALARAEARIKLGREAKAAIKREKDARETLRVERKSLADLITVMTLGAGALWVALMSALNARRRRGELAILRAMGYGTGSTMLLLLVRTLLAAVVGVVLGIASAVPIGLMVTSALGMPAADIPTALSPEVALQLILVLLALAILAAWLPTLTAVRRDPAEFLGRE